MNNLIIRNYETERARLRESINNLSTELTNYMFLEGQHATDQQLADAMAGFRQREREISNAHAANERRLAAVLHAPRFGGGPRQSRIAVAPEEEEPPPPPIIPPLDLARLPPPGGDRSNEQPVSRFPRGRLPIRLARATPTQGAEVEEDFVPNVRDVVYVTGMLLNRALNDPNVDDETLNEVYAEAQRAEQMLYEAERRVGVSPRLRHPFDATRGLRAAAREERVAGAQEAVPETIARRGSGIRNRGRIFHGGANGDDDAALPPPPQGEDLPVAALPASVGGERVRNWRLAEAERLEAEAEAAIRAANAAEAAAAAAYDAVEIGDEAGMDRAGALQLAALRLRDEAVRLRDEADAAMLEFIFDRGVGGHPAL